MSHEPTGPGQTDPPSAAETPAPGDANPDAAIVRDDRLCVSCGYNIRDLPVAGQCPECGTPIQVSLRGRLLRYALPSYLQTLHRGAVLVEVAIVAQIGLAIVRFLVLIWETQPFVPTWIKKAMLGGAAVATALSVLGLIGWWMLSSRDPGEGRQAPGRTTRVVLRWSVAAQLAAAVGSLVVGAVVSAIGAGSAQTLLMAKDAIAWANVLAWIVAFFAGVVYIRHLALRIPSRGLADNANQLKSLATTLVVIAAVIGIGALILSLAPRTHVTGLLRAIGGMVVCIGSPVLGCIALVAFILYVVLIDKARAAIGAERRPEEGIVVELGGE
jgi:predicted RNA-binding Zn-ribbon protein involved in translation (DUF1610 family)